MQHLVLLTDLSFKQFSQRPHNRSHSWMSGAPRPRQLKLMTTQISGDWPTPKEQIVFLCILSGQGHLLVCQA